MRKDDIIARAEEVCRDCQIQSYPVKLLDVCGKYGLSVFQDNLPRDVSGFIVVQDDPFNKYGTGKLIVVNRHEPKGRKRFTIAHELGHYFLHRGEKDALYAHRDAGQRGKIETEADIFASCVLMPENLVREAIENLSYSVGRTLMDETIIGLISYEFIVSRQAAEIRLKQLKIIG